jgi:hypothetical protein
VGGRAADKLHVKPDACAPAPSLFAFLALFDFHYYSADLVLFHSLKLRCWGLCPLGDRFPGEVAVVLSRQMDLAHASVDL